MFELKCMVSNEQAPALVHITSCPIETLNFENTTRFGFSYFATLGVEMPANWEGLLGGDNCDLP